MSDAAPEPGPAGGNRRVLTIAGIAVLGLLLGYLAISALSGGGGSPKAAAPGASPTAPRAAATTTTTTAPSLPAQSFEIFSDKNPFQPLQFAPGAGATTATTAPSGGTTVTTAPSGGTTSGGTVSGGTTTTAGTGSGGAAEPQSGKRVALQDIFASGGRTVANVKVNSTVYTVGVGDTFATNFKVVSLSQSTKCGTFLFGDNQFRLCQGEEVIK